MWSWLWDHHAAICSQRSFIMASSHCASKKPYCSSKKIAIFFSFCFLSKKVEQYRNVAKLWHSMAGCTCQCEATVAHYGWVHMSMWSPGSNPQGGILVVSGTGKRRIWQVLLPRWNLLHRLLEKWSQKRTREVSAFWWHRRGRRVWKRSAQGACLSTEIYTV